MQKLKFLTLEAILTTASILTISCGDNQKEQETIKSNNQKIKFEFKKIHYRILENANEHYKWWNIFRPEINNEKWEKMTLNASLIVKLSIYRLSLKPIENKLITETEKLINHFGNLRK